MNRLDSPSVSIAVVTQGYTTSGGVQAVARWLVSSLRECGFSVTVYDVSSSVRDANSRRLSAPSTWLRRSLIQVLESESDAFLVGGNAVEFEFMRYLPRRELTSRLSQYDVVQVVAGGPALAVAAIGCGRPILLQVATRVASERAKLLSSGGLGSEYRKLMTRLVSFLEVVGVKASFRIFVENTEAMDLFTELSGDERVVLAPPGVDTSTYCPGASPWAQNGHIITLGRLGDPRKGLYRVVLAYSRLREVLPGAPRLILAGRGELDSRTAALIESEGLSDFVDVYRDLSKVECIDLLRGASLFWQASFEEGLGLALIEGMACGLPCVATATAGTQETVLDGVSGYLVRAMDDVSVVENFVEKSQSILGGEGERMAFEARRRAVDCYSTVSTLGRYIDGYLEATGLSGQVKALEDGW